MSCTLTISDGLYARLEAVARKRGFSSVEELLEALHLGEDELRQRQEAVRQIDELRERLFAKYGEMPDSVALIRDDR